MYLILYSFHEIFISLVLPVRFQKFKQFWKWHQNSIGAFSLPYQHSIRINVPCCWKQVAQRWKNSKAKFLFRERAFHFRDRTVVWPSVARSDSPDRGNGKLSRGKEEPERFSIEEQTFSSSADTFFLPLKLHDPTHKSFMDYPLFMDTSDLFSTFYLY